MVYYHYDDSHSDSEEEFPPIAQPEKRRRAVTSYNDDDDDDAEQEFPCVQCDKTFHSKKELIRHKERATDHEYCKLHDMDFDDWEDFAVHRVNSREHRTCEHCYRDFGSKDGLELHKAQFHRGIKTTKCPYCHKSFRGGAAGLTMHFESNQCKGGMTRIEMNGRVNAMKVGKDPVPHDRWQDVGPRTVIATGTDTGHTADVTATLKNLGLDDRAGPDGNEYGIKQEDVKNYYNDLFKKYVCPCGKKFGQTQSMWQHLQSIAHQKKSHLCIGCQKHFKGSSALLQHQQSGAGRCYLASHEAIKSANLATGGLVAEAHGDLDEA